MQSYHLIFDLYSLSQLHQLRDGGLFHISIKYECELHTVKSNVLHNTIIIIPQVNQSSTESATIIQIDAQESGMFKALT